MPRFFLCFVNVADDDAYPVIVGRRPRLDRSGRPYSAFVRHRRRVIELSPDLRLGDAAAAVEYAQEHARRTYPARAGKRPESP